MKKPEIKKQIILIIFLLWEAPVFSQEFSLRVDLDGQPPYLRTDYFRIGLSPYATDGFDPEIDSVAWVFPDDVFIVIEDNWDFYLKYIKSSSLDEKIFKIYIKLESTFPGVDIATLSWDTTGLSRIGNFRLQDQLLGGVFFDSSMTEFDHIEIQRGSLLDLTDLQIKVTAFPVNQSLAVNPYWNFLSLPLKVNNRHYLYLFPNSTPGTLLEFDGSGYVSTDSLKRGKGYWLKFPAADSVSITGGDFGTVEVALDSGWNMIGGVSRDVPFDKINDPNDIIIPGTLFGFDGVYTTSDTIRPGSGYWVRAFASGQVTISCVASLQGFGKSLAAPISLEGFPSLTLSDAGGVSQTLYFNVKLDNPKQKLSYSLPPKMSGIFDARFAGDFRISESDEAIIEIQATAYPITITPENMTETFGEQYALVEILAGEEGETHPLNAGESVTISNPLVKKLRLKKIQNNVPQEFALHQNYPNPFNSSTTIKYDLPKRTKVKIIIYDILGRKVKTVIDKTEEAGYKQIVWNGQNNYGFTVASGLYFYRIETENFVKTRKLLLIK